VVRVLKGGGEHVARRVGKGEGELPSGENKYRGRRSVHRESTGGSSYEMRQPRDLAEHRRRGRDVSKWGRKSVATGVAFSKFREDGTTSGVSKRLDGARKLGNGPGGTGRWT